MLYPNISYRDEAVVTNSTVVSSHIYREEFDDILRECYEVQDDIIEIYNGKCEKVPDIVEIGRPQSHCL